MFLYGPPGVGKLTVGTELAALTGFKLVHNHLSVNLVTSVFPFQSDAWVRLLRRVRQDVFGEATAENVDLVITGVFSGTSEGIEAWRTMLGPIQVGGGSVLYVQLFCERGELFARVQNESRRVHGKLTDPQILADLSEKSDLFASLPFEPQVKIDSTHLSPREVANQIAAHYSLPLCSAEAPSP